MIVTLDSGEKKDLHYSIVARLLKSGKATINPVEAAEPAEIHPVEAAEPKKRGRKPREN